MTKKKEQVFCRKCKAFFAGDPKSRDGLCRKCRKERDRDWRK